MVRLNKKTKKFFQSGQVARLLLVLAVVILLAIVITFLVIKMTSRPAAPNVETETPVALPVYEATLANIKFIFQHILTLIYILYLFLDI